MAQYINKAALVAEIERRKNQFVSQAEAFHKIGKEDKESYYAALASNMNSLSCFLDTLEEEPISNDLEEAAKIYEEDAVFYASRRISDYFKAGAQWQKEQMIEKACVWLNNFYSEDRHCYFVEEDIDNFKKAMEE